MCEKLIRMVLTTKRIGINIALKLQTRGVSTNNGGRINIAEEVYGKIRLVWLRLSENDLLEKCLHGRTQM